MIDELISTIGAVVRASFTVQLPVTVVAAADSAELASPGAAA